MTLLQFSQQSTPARLPVTITWPAGTPEDALPANHKRLPDGRLQAVYQTLTELAETIAVLTMVNQAAEIGGKVYSDPVQLEM